MITIINIIVNTIVIYIVITIIIINSKSTTTGIVLAIAAVVEVSVAVAKKKVRHIPCVWHKASTVLPLLLFYPNPFTLRAAKRGLTIL